MFRCLGQGPSVKESMARGGPLGVAPPFAVVESGDGDGPAEVNLLLLQNFENSRDDVDFVGEKQGSNFPLSRSGAGSSTLMERLAI